MLKTSEGELERDADVGALPDVSSPSSVVVIAFGGLMMSVGGIPPFEFFGVLNKAAPAKKLFFRDHRLSWYHRGVRGFAPDIKGIEAGIRDIIAELNPTKVVMLGSSAGGYAALLFGRLLGATEVHAFGPQTFISPTLRLRHHDNQWRRPWLSLMLSGRYQTRYGDLYRLFRRTPSSDTRFVIHYCRTTRLDTVHAERLGRHPDVELRHYEEGGHNVVKHLRETGELQSLLQLILAH